MDGNAPATKQDIADLDQKIEQLRAEMKMDMEQLRSEIVTVIVTWRSTWTILARRR